MHQSITEFKALPAFPLPVATFVVAANIKHRTHNTELEYDQAPEKQNKTSLKTVFVINYA